MAFQKLSLGSLAAKARIIPVDQRYTLKGRWLGRIYVYRLCSHVIYSYILRLHKNVTWYWKIYRLCSHGDYDLQFYCILGGKLSLGTWKFVHQLSPPDTSKLVKLLFFNHNLKTSSLILILFVSTVVWN